MKVLFSTNFPAQYRVDFFNELGKYCDLTVVFEREKALHRDEKWNGGTAENFKAVYLNMKPFGTSRSIGIELARYISNNEFDAVVFSGYASPAVMLAIIYCNIKKRKYYIEYDGGFYKNDTFFKRMLKKYMVSGAYGHFITCSDTEKLLVSLGVDRKKLLYYPFSSLRQRDILEKPLDFFEKQKNKKKLGISEQFSIISVGRFVHGKGFDELLTSLDSVKRSVGVYIIGGEPTEEYLELCKKYNLSNVKFLPFCKKDTLFEWYKACDLFVFPTRSDIWGLVINEAMACGLPVVSSDMCIAAKELIEDGVTGYLYKSGDNQALANCINLVISKETNAYSQNCLNRIRGYTIENMAKVHMELLKDNLE